MLDKNEVLRYLGYSGQELNPNIDIQLDKHIALAEKALKPKFMYRIFNIEVNDAVRILESDITFFGNDIKKHLQGASKCAVMAATLGFESERLLSVLSKTDISSAVIFDAVCTAKIEDVCDECEEQIKKYANENGYYTNFRYSPGYGDFLLDYQNQITKLLMCDKNLGLTVTESSLLIPQKSVTAIIGLFREKPIENKKSCKECNLFGTCEFTKKGITCERGNKNGF